MPPTTKLHAIAADLRGILLVLESANGAGLATYSVVEVAIEKLADLASQIEAEANRPRAEG